MQIDNGNRGRVVALDDKTRRFALCALLVLAVLATSSAWGREANYVPPSKIAWELVLPPPPAPDSKAQQADLQAVLDAQRKRSKSEAEASKADAQISAFRIGDVLGPKFTAEQLPFTAEFLRRATSDMGDAISSSKKHFNRPRPYVVSAKVKPTIDPPGGGSYPSGHSTFAHLNGILIAAMVPERASEIFERAERYANHRIVAGVHFPTDVEAGRILASVIANALLQEPQFKADLQRATSEVRAALGLPELTARTE